MKKKLLIALFAIAIITGLVFCFVRMGEEANLVENTVEQVSTVETPEPTGTAEDMESAVEKEGFLEENPDLISGISPSDEDFIVGAVNQTPVYYSQIDSRWKSHPYTSIGKASQTIGSSGCGPTCSAMVVSSIKGTIRPDEMGDLYVKYGYRSPNDGTYFSAFQWTANRFNIPFKRVWNVNDAIELVRQGYYVITSCGPGLFTTGGHFIVIYDIEGSTLKIFDPYNYNGKFNYGNRGGKVTLDGNTINCSIANFKAYANSGAWFGFKANEAKPVEPTTPDTPVPTPVPDTPKTGVVSVNSSLNVRRGPGTNYSYVRSLYNGNKVTIYETVNGWYRIGTNEWVIDDYVRVGESTKPTTSTVGQTRKLKSTTTLYSKSNLSGTTYTYLPNTTVKILENVNANVDRIYVPATGRYAYVEVVAYKEQANTSTPAVTNTVGQYKKFRTTYTYIYSKSNLSGTRYTYLANTKVKVLKNVSTTVDYIYVPATGRYGYVSTSVYK